MAARFLFRRAAGMEDGGGFIRRETGQVQFLECDGRHGGNLRPMFNNLRRDSARLANCPVGGIVFELEREQFQREFVEIFKVGADMRRLIIKSASGN